MESLRDEAEYFTNQAWREVRRVAMTDYELARENFVNMGEMMMRLVYQTNIGWQEFLGFYTGLNTVRKNFDEKYAEQRGIGEEVDDPNNSEGEENPTDSQAMNQYPRFSVAYRSMPAPQVNGNRLSAPAIDPEAGLNQPLLGQQKQAVNGSDASGLLEEDEESKKQ